jgi:hypothetical protein
MPAAYAREVRELRLQMANLGHAAGLPGGLA